MGKFVERVEKAKQKLQDVKKEVEVKIEKYNLAKDAIFTELVEKVAKLEATLNDLIEKISGMKVEVPAEKPETKANKKDKKAE